MKNILRKLMFGLALVASAAMSGCSDDPEAINGSTDEGPALGQALMPLNFKASVLSTGNEVHLSWDTRKGVAYYEVAIYSDEALTTQVKTVSDIARADVPVTVELDPECDYWATVQAFNENKGDKPSRLAVAGPFTTYAIMSPLNPEVTARTSSSVTLKWTQDDYVSHLLATPVTGEGLEPVKKELSAAEVAAAEATVEGLNPSTFYNVSLFYNSASRGGQDVSTYPNVEGTVEVATAAELLAAVEAGAKKVLLTNLETPYDVTPPAEPAGSTNALSNLSSDLAIYGKASFDGAKPVLVGLHPTLIAGAAAYSLHLEDLILDGNASGAAINVAPASKDVADPIKITSIVVKNCEIYNYTQGVISENTTLAEVGSMTFDGMLVHHIAGDGGDCIDFRMGTYGDVTVANSTFYGLGDYSTKTGARSFLFMQEGTINGNVKIANNTISSFGVNTNRKGVICLRAANLTAEKFAVSNNLVLNEYNTGDYTFISNYSNAVMPTMTANYFFNFYEGEKDGKPAGFMYSSNNGLTPELCLAGGGKVLTEDPCEKSMRGKFYLVNPEVSANKIGDPRWWNAVAPVVPEQTELNAITAATVWNLADDEAFPPQEITRNKILSNIQFYVKGEENPMKVTDNGTILFSTASTVSKDGVPSDNALGILVSTPGTIILTPAEAAYNTHMEVIVAGERYAVPANGEQGKIGLADIAEPTMIYICSCSEIELTALEWSLEVVSGGEPKPLNAPVFTTENPNADKGSEAPVVIEWSAVEQAESYEVTFNGTTSTVTEPTISLNVKTLQAGKYDLTVVAKPKEGSLNYVASEVATISIEINGVLEAISTEYTWNITDAALFPNGDVLATKVYGNLQFIADETKKMTIDQGEKRIKFNGKSTMGDGFVPTQRGLAFRVIGNGTLTVKAISSSSSDATREVGVSANGKEYLREACPTSSDGEAKTVVFDDLTGETVVYIYCYNTINIYEMSWKPAEGTVPAAKNYTTVISATGGVVSDNVVGLPSKFADATTWTATDETGTNTLTFTGNVYYSTNTSKNLVWSFDKKNAATGTYVSCDNLGKVRKITMTMNINKSYVSKDLTLYYDAADDKKVLATTEDPETKSSVFTWDFEAAGINTGYIKFFHNNSGQGVEIASVTIEYTK